MCKGEVGQCGPSEYSRPWQERRAALAKRFKEGTQEKTASITPMDAVDQRVGQIGLGA
jgi:hypothetical protein